MNKSTRKKAHYETSEFDQEFVADTFHKLSPEKRAEWNRIKRKSGRPRRGNGPKLWP